MKLNWKTSTIAAILGIVVGYGVACGIKALEPPPPDIVESKLELQVIDPAVQIGEHCSGTIISDNVVLTAAHCVEGVPKSEHYITLPLYDKHLNKIDEKKYDLEILKISDKYDLAVLTVKDAHFNTYAKIGFETELVQGMEVVNSAFPGNSSELLSKGFLGPKKIFGEEFKKLPDLMRLQLEKTFKKHIGKEFLYASLNIDGGSSGSGLFVKDSSGNYVLIGVTSMVKGESGFVGLFVPIEHIKEFVLGAQESQ